MAQPTQLIYEDSPGAVPANYKVPPSLDLVLQSVVVKWNGASAAGAFLPTLGVYSQDGKLVGRFHPGTQVEAGDTAEVTYAPFLRGASGGTQEDTFAHFRADVSPSAGKLVPNTTVTELTGSTSVTGSGIAFDPFLSAGRVALALDGNWFYTATLRVVWPAFAGDRYIELTSATPATDFVGIPVPARLRQAATPDGDIQEITANLVPTTSSGFRVLKVQVFQASGAGQTITDWNLTILAHAFQTYIF